MEYEYTDSASLEAASDIEAEEEENGNIVNIPVKRATALVHEYINDITRADDVYEVEAVLKTVRSLIDRLINQTEMPGDADDIHNLSVELASADLYDIACELLEEGLQKFPKNTDLLADYIQYGMSCGQIQKCDKYYKILKKIPKIRWTWRSYCFSVNYILFLWDRCDSEKELEKLQAEMLSLADDFKKRHHDNEESYRCEADIYRKLYRKDDEERVLRQALEDITIAPKCALRLADMLVDRGDYEEAYDIVNKAIGSRGQTQRSVNEGYLYFLRGLIRMAKANDVFTEEITDSIYADFEMALRHETRPAYSATMKSKAIDLINFADFPVPEKYEELHYLID